MQMIKPRFQPIFVRYKTYNGKIVKNIFTAQR